MVMREIDVHVGAPGIHRWHRLRLDLPDDADREEVMKAVADEFGKVEPPALVHARRRTSPGPVSEERFAGHSGNLPCRA